MSKPLVIVESPAKAKTISQFLGSEFIVRASVGHIADLPSKGLAVDVDNDFKAAYELTERGRQVIRDLKADLKNASVVYLATDEDREGEAISAHLREYLNPKVDVHRMVFTKSPSRPLPRPSPIPGRSTPSLSMPPRHAACSTACTATRSPRCCGRRSCRACPPVACNRLP